MKRVIAAFAAGLAVAGYLWLTGADTRTAGILPYQDPQAVAAGQRIYQDHCASCHGADLRGEPDWQTRDSEGHMPAPPQDASGHTWHHPDAKLLEITRHGMERLVGNGYRSRMQGYAGVLSEQEMLEALAFIKSRWPADIIARHNQINSQEAE